MANKIDEAWQRLKEAQDRGAPRRETGPLLAAIWEAQQEARRQAHKNSIKDSSLLDWEMIAAASLAISAYIAAIFW